MNEKFSLKWSKFQQHTSLTFKDLRADKEYFDVTLACDDHKDVSAHKVILSSCSPYFRNLLSRNKHSHPLVYMRGMQSDDVERILDFMYQGEVDVAQDNLARFLEIADELKINGLDSSEHDRNNMNISDGLEETPKFLTKVKDEQLRQLGKNMPMNRPPVNHFNNQQPIGTISSEPRYSQPTQSEPVHARYDEFDDSSLIVDDNSMHSSKYPGMINSEADDPTILIESLIQKIDNGKWQCNVCMKIQKSHNHSKEHVEIHIEGLSYSCDNCGKSCRTSGALRHHKRMHKHQGIPDTKIDLA